MTSILPACSAVDGHSPTNRDNSTIAPRETPVCAHFWSLRVLSVRPKVRTNGDRSRLADDGDVLADDGAVVVPAAFDGRRLVAGEDEATHAVLNRELGVTNVPHCRSCPHSVMTLPQLTDY